MQPVLLSPESSEYTWCERNVAFGCFSPYVGDLRGPQVNVVLDFRMEWVFSLLTVKHWGRLGAGMSDVT